MENIGYFDGHNDVLLKLFYSKNKIKINDFIEGNENYHIDIPKINKANFIGGFFAIFSPNEKPTEEFFSRMKANTYNYRIWFSNGVLMILMIVYVFLWLFVMIFYNDFKIIC